MFRWSMLLDLTRGKLILYLVDEQMLWARTRDSPQVMRLVENLLTRLVKI